MEREQLVEIWQDAWNEGLWYAAWSKALEGLSPEQAAWKPAPDRHSIWQNVTHILFWREYTRRRAAGDRPPQEEVDRRNWEEPRAVTAATWEETVNGYRDSQEAMVRALKAEQGSLERFLYHLFHDSYHMGQIMQLRAMQGFPFIE